MLEFLSENVAIKSIIASKQAFGVTPKVYLFGFKIESDARGVKG